MNLQKQKKAARKKRALRMYMKKPRHDWAFTTLVYAPRNLKTAVWRRLVQLKCVKTT